MMTDARFVSFDGEVISPEQVPVDFTSRAFRYGDSVFETMRASRLRLHFPERHLTRLTLSLQWLKMEPVVSLNSEQLQYMADKLLKAIRCYGGCRLRLTVFREKGGLYLPSGNKAHVLLEAFPTEELTYNHSARSLKIDIYPDMRKPINPMSQFKSGNALLYVMAALWAAENRFDDALIINENGNLCEATSSNLFVFRKDSLLTPSLDEGCVAGVMRETIIEIASRAGITVYDDTYVSRNELLTAEEIFLTNAAAGIMPVLAYKNKRYYSKMSKILADLLNKEVM